MKTLTTQQIAQACGGVCSGTAQISSVAIDNREVSSDSLFIAIKGDRLDGHQFAQDAAEAGAAAVMVHEDIDCGVPTIKVADTKKALLDLARYYRSTFDIPLIALTGSVGKTTTKEMIWCVLSAKYNAHKTSGNLNNEIGVPRVLLGLEKEHTAAVVEMGMDMRGQISVLTKTTLPNMAVITNIGVSHIENLGSREEILKSKLEITEGLSEGSPLILNADNDLLSTVKEADFGGKFYIKWFGIRNNADVTASDINYLDSSTEFTAHIGGDSFKVTIPTTGEHNVYDALAALCVGHELGIENADMSEALMSYTPAGMRERIETVAGVTLIEDCYNASPDSVKALSETLRIKGGSGKRVIAVIADMLELGEHSEEAHKDIGKYLADAGVDLLLTYGEFSKFTAESANKNGIIRVFDFDDKTELAKHLIPMLKPGDVVAFKGSRGMKLEDVIASVKAELEKR